MRSYHQSGYIEVSGLFGKIDQMTWKIANEETFEKEAFLKKNVREKYTFIHSFIHSSVLLRVFEMVWYVIGYCLLLVHIL